MIGKSLTHSFSPGYFSRKFRNEGIRDTVYENYELYELSPQALDQIFNSGVLGLNVTIPYKESVVQYMDELSTEAAQLGAVNTITIDGNKLIGHNTDTWGFDESLKKVITLSGKHHALILGSGGAAKAVTFVLQKYDIQYQIVSRKKEYLNYGDVDKSVIDSHNIIINTTPLGMYPDISLYPDIPYQYLGAQHLVYDLIYNPEKTLFLIKAELQSATIKNGLEMLELQAEASWKIWNNTI